MSSEQRVAEARMAKLNIADVNASYTGPSVISDTPKVCVVGLVCWKSPCGSVFQVARDVRVLRQQEVLRIAPELLTG